MRLCINPYHNNSITVDIVSVRSVYLWHRINFPTPQQSLTCHRVHVMKGVVCVYCSICYRMPMPTIYIYSVHQRQHSAVVGMFCVGSIGHSVNDLNLDDIQLIPFRQSQALIKKNNCEHLNRNIGYTWSEREWKTHMKGERMCTQMDMILGIRGRNVYLTMKRIDFAGMISLSVFN